MRTPKRLYAQERMIYQPELLTCPHCGDLLVMCNYLAWDKTVQTLDRVLSIASRPGHCPKATCRGLRMRLLSAEAQRMALPGSTYGYDVLGRRVAVLARGPMPAGAYSKRWNGHDDSGKIAGPGVYFLRLRVGQEVFKLRSVMLQ